MQLTKLIKPVLGNAHYRPDIDGLRAIAVLFVVFFHAFPNTVTGGFIGVDIFFVISGYLISAIIFNQIKVGKFTIRDFYVRRINRIFPALIFVALACIVAAKILMFRDENADFNLSMFFSTAFLANIYFLVNLNYFADSAENNPLLHLWSLGVEEQFYIIWPLLLAYLARKPFDLAIKVVAATIAISFILNVVMVSQSPSQAFYLPFTRFWELGVGSLCAYIQQSGFIKNRNDMAINTPFFLNSFVFLGLGLLLFGEYYIDTSSIFPGWNALIPVAGTALILSFGQNSYLGQNLLSNPILVFIGVISYPLYLWHWPILSFLHITQGPISREFKLCAVLISGACAVITYYLIERPVRFSIKSKLKPLILLLCLLGIGLYSIASYYNLSNRSMDLEDKFVSHYKNYVDQNHFVEKNRIDCGFINTNGTLRDNIPPNCLEKHNPTSVMIWGDSHAYQFYYGLKQNLPKDIDLIQVASSGCAPSTPELHQSLSKNCVTANNKAIEAIKTYRPTVVVLAQKEHHLDTQWEKLEVQLKSMGVKKVILVGPVPQWNQYLYRIYAKNYLGSNDMPQYIKDKLSTEIIESDRKLKLKFDDNPQLKYISIIESSCPKDQGCLAYITDNDPNQFELTTFDYGHITLGTSDLYAKKLLVPTIMQVIRDSK